MKSISLIFSPYHVGIYGRRVGAGPIFIRERGIVEELEQLGIPVHVFEIEPVDETGDEATRSFEILRRTASLVTRECDKGSFPIILSGNCTAAVGVAAGLTGSNALIRRELGCVWIDAHSDIDTPDDLVSGYGDSMGVAMLAGWTYKTLVKSVPGHRNLNLDKLLQIGVHDLTEEERSRVVKASYDVIWGSRVEKVDYRHQLGRLLARKELGPTMIHLDLDCLDLSLGKVSQYGSYGGLLEEDLIGCLEEIVQKTEPQSLTVACFDPSFEGKENIARIAMRAVKSFTASLLQA